MTRISHILGASLALISLAACGATTTGSGDADAGSSLQVDVHNGEFATIQQFTTPGGISVWLVEEPSIPILS